jgi:transposase-like protein
MAQKARFNYEEELTKCKTLEDITGTNGLVQRLIKDAVETVLQQEMDVHLNGEEGIGNKRNGSSKKRIKTEYGDVEINVPRDRNGEYAPEALKKRETISDGLETQIVSMYGKGMTTRDISSHIEGLYGTEISAQTISNITDKIMTEVKEWSNRSLDPLYPIVFLDALHYKVREDGRVINKAVYVALGINMTGRKEVLGMWVGGNEGAKFWLSVCNELKNRGVKDILIACVDGLTGFPEAIHASYPDTEIQLCIIHQIRNTMKYIASKEQREFMNELKLVYRAADEESGHEALLALKERWSKKYAMVLDSWFNKWDKLSTFFRYEQGIRKIIYTTNTLEGFNRQLRKPMKSKSIFPNDDALRKSLYLATKDIIAKWTMPYQNWGQTLAQFAVYFDGRVKLDIS